MLLEKKSHYRRTGFNCVVECLRCSGYKHYAHLMHACYIAHACKCTYMYVYLNVYLITNSKMSFATDLTLKHIHVRTYMCCPYSLTHLSHGSHCVAGRPCACRTAAPQQRRHSLLLVADRTLHSVLGLHVQILKSSSLQKETVSQKIK